MFEKVTATALAACLFAIPAFAEDFKVEMLNKGEEGVMVFVPNFVEASVGDTITFVSVDKGHNAQTIKGMWPEGAEPIKSKMSKDFTMTVEVDGLYGVKCTPHFGMGMVMLIQVGEPVNLEAVQGVKLRGKTKKRLKPLIEAVAG